MSKYHINTEVLLAIAYALICILLLIFATTRLPTTLKKKVNGLVHHSLYFLLWGALVPAWVLYSSIRTINTLSQAALTLEANPHLIDKHKGKVLKQQRNIVIGTAGIVLFFILWRVNKIVSSYEGMVKVESAPASPVAASATAPASAVTAGNSSTFAPSAPTKSAIENSDARDTLTKRAAAKSANLKKID